MHACIHVCVYVCVLVLPVFVQYFSVHLGRLLEKRSASPWDSKLVLKLLWIFCIGEQHSSP